MIAGIISKLEYLKEIGVGGTWLSPIFKSPMKDFGYDISNFYEIQEEYGTMEDAIELFAKAKELDIKIILDFVPNHSSDQCEWFIKSVNNDPEYRDYYIWHEGIIVDGVRRPPNNWVQYIDTTSILRSNRFVTNSIHRILYFMDLRGRGMNNDKHTIFINSIRANRT